MYSAILNFFITKIACDRSDNQFVSHRVPVKDILLPTDNELVINFVSAFRKVGHLYI
jgi:hypothetical protein